MFFRFFLFAVIIYMTAGVARAQYVYGEADTIVIDVQKIESILVDSLFEQKLTSFERYELKKRYFGRDSSVEYQLLAKDATTSLFARIDQKGVVTYFIYKKYEDPTVTLRYKRAGYYKVWIRKSHFAVTEGSGPIDWPKPYKKVVAEVDEVREVLDRTLHQF